MKHTKALSIFLISIFLLSSVNIVFASQVKEIVSNPNDIAKQIENDSSHNANCEENSEAIVKFLRQELDSLYHVVKTDLKDKGIDIKDVYFGTPFN